MNHPEFGALQQIPLRTQDLCRLADLPSGRRFALHVRDTLTKTVAHVLGRQQKELSWIRDELLRAGDIYSPAHGRVTMSVPAFTPFLRSHCEQGRSRADGSSFATFVAYHRDRYRTPWRKHPISGGLR